MNHLGTVRSEGGPGLRPTLTRCLVTLTLGLALTACGTSGKVPQTAQAPVTKATEPPLGYRSLPTFLPQTSAPVDQVVDASPTHAQLAVQGVAVRVDLPTGHVLATVTGPKVPPFVAPPPPEVTATFDVTFAQASGTIPIRLTDFTVTDQLGHTYRPVLVAREAVPPSVAPAGRTLTFQVTAVMPTGEGRIHWAPIAGAPIVSWDFIVEND